MTVSPPRGAAIGHSGQVRHSGVAITRGERYILVGFVGCTASPYTVHAADWAAHDAFLKFGAAAWGRSAAEEHSDAPRLVVGGGNESEPWPPAPDSQGEAGGG